MRTNHADGRTQQRGVLQSPVFSSLSEGVVESMRSSTHGVQHDKEKMPCLR